MTSRTGRIAGAVRPRKWTDLKRSHRATGCARDSGFTLVEVVMTVVLIAMTVIPIIDATFTSIKASTTVREVAEVDTVLQNAADRVNRAPTSCDYTMYVQAAALSRGWKASQVSAVGQYYEPPASGLATDPGSWQAGTCPGNPPSPVPQMIQKVTVTVFSESGSVDRSIQVVKSDV